MNLETLNIVSCEQVIFPVWVPESLKHLDFQALDIKGLPDFVFGSSLESIYLCACEGFADLPESLPETITGLSFSCGRLKGVPPFVSLLPRLRKLELWGNKPELEPCEVLNARREKVTVEWEAALFGPDSGVSSDDGD